MSLMTLCYIFFVTGWEDTCIGQKIISFKDQRNGARGLDV